MSITIVDVPQTVNGLLTKAIGALTQIPYSYQHVDYFTDSTIDSGGQQRIRLDQSFGNIAADFTAGNTIYYASDSGIIPNGFYTISDIQWINPRTTMVIDYPYVENGLVAHTVNNIPLPTGFRFQVNVFDSAGTLLTTDNPLIYIPNRAGTSGLVDLSTTISTLMAASSFISFEFYTEVEETWNGAPTQTPIQTTTIQGLLARRQPLHLGGALLWENLLVEDVFAREESTWINENTLAPLTGTAWTYVEVEPNNIGWNVNSSGAGVSQFLNIHDDVTVREYFFARVVFKWVKDADSTQLNIQLYREQAGALLSIVNNQLADGDGTTGTLTVDYGIEMGNYQAFGFGVDASAGFSVSILSFEQRTGAQLLTRFTDPKMWLGWNRTATCLIDAEFATRNIPEVGFQWVSNELDINRGGLESTKAANQPNIDTQVSIFLIPQPVNPLTAYQRMRVRGSSGTTILSESVFYRVQNECPHPVMLDWFNEVGGVDQFMFSMDQLIDTEAEEGLVGETQIQENIEFVTRTKFRVTQRQRQRMTLTAENITTNDLVALRFLKFSDSIRLYLSKDGTNYINVIAVDNFSTPYQTTNLLHSFIITIEMPDNFDWEQAKLY